MITVAAGILVHDGMMLIAKRRQSALLPNLWVLPGGRVEPGETPEVCLQRELWEEFGIVVKVADHVAASVYDYDFGTVELIVFRAEWQGGDFESKDHEEIRWVFPHEVAEYDFAPADAAVLQRIGSGDIKL